MHMTNILVCCHLSFKEFINSHHPKDILDVDEFLRLRNQVFASKSALHTADVDDTDSPPAGVEEPPPGLEVPPGEEPAPGTVGTTSKVSVTICLLVWSFARDFRMVYVENIVKVAYLVAEE